MGQLLPHDYIAFESNFPMDNAIDFLFSTLHITPFHYGVENRKSIMAFRCGQKYIKPKSVSWVCFSRYRMSNDRNKKKDVSNWYAGQVKKKRGGGGGVSTIKLAPTFTVSNGSILRAKQILQQRTGTDSAVVGTRLHG